MEVVGLRLAKLFLKAFKVIPSLRFTLNAIHINRGMLYDCSVGECQDWIKLIPFVGFVHRTPE